MSTGFDTINKTVSGECWTNLGMIPLKMFVLRWTKSKRLSPGCWRAPAVTMHSFEPAVTEKSSKKYDFCSMKAMKVSYLSLPVLANTFAFLINAEPCCRSIISPINLSAATSIKATSLETFYSMGNYQLRICELIPPRKFHNYLS